MAMTGGTARLVHTGYGGGASNFPIKLYVYYKTSQSVASNQSTVTCGMYVVTNAGWDIGSWTDSRGSYVGTESNTFNGSIPNFSGTRWLVENKTFTVNHNDDGTGTATMKWKWGVNSPWGGFENESGSFSITLPTIARASVPKVDKTAVRMGATVTIDTQRKSSSFTHTLKYTFGGSTATIATGVGATYNWKIPDLAAKCNNALSGACVITCETYNGGTKVGTNTCTLTLSVPLATTPSLPNGDVILGSGNPITTVMNSTNFTATLTYSFGSLKNQPIVSKTTGGSIWWTSYDLAKQIKDKPSGTGEIHCSTWNGNALVGTNTIPFTAVVPDNSTTKPKIDAFTLTPSGGLSSAFSGLYIQGKTGVKANFTASSVYSTVAGYKLTADGRVYTGNPATSAVLTRSGNIDIVGTVTDARGYSNSSTKTITVHAYSKPTLSGIICQRSTDGKVYKDDGTYLHIKATRKYTPLVVDGVQRNHCSILCRVTPEGGTASEYTLLPASNTTTDTYDALVPNVTLATDKSYDVQLVVKDEISAENPYHYPIPTAAVTLHLGEGGYGVAVGKYSEGTREVPLFESAWNANFEKDVNIDGSIHFGGIDHLPRIGYYDGKNFNDLVQCTGYYPGTSLPSSVGCQWFPTDKTGVLQVISQMGKNADTGALWGFAYQTYRTHDGAVYTRSYFTGSGFTAWALQDGIVEQGTSGVWTYRKWSSGLAECWCKRSFDVNISSSWGALYYGTATAFAYPFTFAEAPACVVDVEYGNNDVSLFIASSGKGTTTNTRPVMLCRTTTGTVNCTLIYHAKGRWK